MEQKQLGGRPN